MTDTIESNSTKNTTALTRETAAVQKTARAIKAAIRAKRLYNSTATRDAIIEEISKQIILAAKGGAGL